MEKSNVDPTDRDPVVAAVKQLNEPYKNTEFRRRPAYEYGSTKVHSVVFKGEDGEWRENYAFEKGKTIIAYHSLVDLLKDRKTYFLPFYQDHDSLKIITIILMALAFSAAFLYLVASGAKPESLQLLTGILGLLVGYLIGNVPGQKS
ncbi:hypothetical protein [Rhizobium leguminosarum]|uniref:Putative integral membrane protein n=1 Tax=Rhizobium leguminosarum TaxID=384 RepID=A0A2Z4YDE4_RHILE|nr:hypothetical protein [Rhizobium leguminosarum]AXA39417.1 putative integral membrane protein [Rhizobium leguminosarum]